MKEKIIIVAVAMCGLLVWEKVAPFRKNQGNGYWGRALNNFMLYAFKIALNLALFKQTFAIIDGFEARGAGLLPALGLSEAWRVVLGMLALDFGAYLLHLTSHKVSLLWRLHRVHHTDLFIDVTTYFRTHPLEALVAWAWTLAVIAVAGVPAKAYAFHMVTMVLIALFQHANVRLPLAIERVLGFLLITPDLHKVHHSEYQPETDSNYGTTLSLWDRLCGTLKPRKEPGQLTYGLGGKFTQKKWHDFKGLLSTPFA